MRTKASLCIVCDNLRQFGPETGILGVLEWQWKNASPRQLGMQSLIALGSKLMLSLWSGLQQTLTKSPITITNAFNFVNMLLSVSNSQHGCRA